MKHMFVIEESHWQDESSPWSEFAPLEAFCTAELAEERRKKYTETWGKFADFRVVRYVAE
jgi:hypothetical protein